MGTVVCSKSLLALCGTCNALLLLVEYREEDLASSSLQKFCGRTLAYHLLT